MMKKYKNLFRNEKLKKKILFSVFTFCFSALAIAQTANENYTYTKVYLSADGSKKAESVQYFDDLGRPKQSVQVKATPLGQDLVVPVVYDPLGRQTKSLLPVPMPTANLGIQNASENSVNTYYGVANAYSQQKLEASPLARPLEVAHPGTEWAMGSGHTQKIDYALNKNGDQVKKYTVTNSWQSATAVSSLPAVSFYNEKVLTKNTATDEDGNKTIEFKNGLGQTVLVRKVITATENADTYYIYNNYGHLVYVTSPKVELLISTGGNTVTQQILDDLCYQYKYDNKGRLVEKKLPGKGWEYMVYDKQNRLVLSQDAALRTTTNTFNAKGWMFTKYDQFGRVLYTGFFSNTGSRAAMQTAINNMTANSGNNEVRSTTPITQNGMDVYYTKNAFPTGSMTIMSVSYYDTYPSYSFNPSFPTDIFGKSVLTDQSTANVSTRTLPVMTLVKNIEDHGWTKSYVYYDNQARAIGSYSINHLGGYTRTESDLDFAGVPLQVKSYHKRLNSDTEKIITQTFTYDHQNRLLTHKHKIDNNTEEILTQNDYNELSQLRSKKVGGTVLGSGLQTVDYLYNIRGWMTQINDPQNLGNDLFGYEIRYNDRKGLETPDALDGTLQVKPKFNGNIAEVDWRTSTQENEPLKRYGYVYDGLNRLTAGFYQKTGTEASKEYFEKIEYDLNGNITRLKRSEGILQNGTAIQVDNLKYDYMGNKLIKISDEQQNPSGYPYLTTPNVIEYDNNQINGNGNMTKHLDKGISSIQYNYLNLPTQITQNAELTQNVYRADGAKVKKLFGDIETNYLDGFQYKSTKPSEGLAGGGFVIVDPNEIAVMKLRIIPTSEGYFDALTNQYIYNYTDHLGNVRLSYSDTNKDGIIQPRQYNMLTCTGGTGPFDPPMCIDNWKPGEIVEVNNYYPFGLMHNYTATTQNAYQYKYNGKELQETGMYDYGARFYMPDIGRWGVTDPMAEATSDLSPYHYANNNPVMFNDPTGMVSQSFMDQVWGSASGTTWYNTGGGFVSDGGNAMDYDGNRISWGSGYTDMLMQSVGLSPMGQGGGGAVDVLLEQVWIPWKKDGGKGAGSYNGLMMDSGILGALQDWSFYQAMSLWQRDINETAIGKSIGNLETFLFMDLPMSFAGEGLIAAGWKAAGLNKLICGPLGRISNGLLKICFTEGTLVATENGNKKIEDIKEGDLVWSYNEETGKKELKKVVELSRNTSSSLVKISVNGTEITCTPEHPFYVDGNWIEAKNLTKGILLTTLDGTTFPLESINFLDEKVKVYNFEVEDNHNYYVSEKGILVHNNCEWASAITNTLENASSGATRHISEHFFAGEINIGGRPLSQMFQKGLSYKDVLQEAALRIGKGEGAIGTSAQGAREVILDFGRTINQSGTTTQVRIWMNEAGTNIRSLHPYLK